MWSCWSALENDPAAQPWRSSASMAAGEIWNLCGLSGAREGVEVLVRDLGKHVIFASFTASSNQHLDVDIAGVFFGPSFGIRRSLRDVRPGGTPQFELRHAFVCMDWG